MDILADPERIGRLDLCDRRYDTVFVSHKRGPILLRRKGVSGLAEGLEGRRSRSQSRPPATSGEPK